MQVTLYQVHRKPTENDSTLFNKHTLMFSPQHIMDRTCKERSLFRSKQKPRENPLRNKCNNLCWNVIHPGPVNLELPDSRKRKLNELESLSKVSG